MAKYRIKIASLSDYTQKPWYHLEKKTWYGWWKYVNSGDDFEFLELMIKAMQQDPVYYG